MRCSRWVSDLGQDLTGKLARLGLVEHKVTSNLETFLGRFLENHRANSAPSTLANFRQLERSLIEFLGPRRDLRTITEGEADDWRQSLSETYAEATLNKLVKRARQVFKADLRKRVCDSNPFAEIRGGSEVNDARQHFVDRAVIDGVLEACPDAQWRLIVALARYGGLRTPSEVLALRWDNIDWQGQRITISSPKTRKQGKPWRTMPLFPELQPYLQEAFELAIPGADEVISRYRKSNANLRTQLLRILRKAGVEPWPRLFQNLRATRKTELAGAFPLHVVTRWRGNTPKVADKHYLQVTPEHYVQAVAQGGANGGAAGGRTRSPLSATYILDLTALTASCRLSSTRRHRSSMGQFGFEQWDTQRPSGGDLPPTPTSIERTQRSRCGHETLLVFGCLISDELPVLRPHLQALFVQACDQNSCCLWSHSVQVG